MKFHVVRPFYAVLSLAFFSFGVVIALLFYTVGWFWIMIAYSICWIFTMIGTYNNCVIKSVIINANSIVYTGIRKRYIMSWEEINTIGIGYVPVKALGGPPWIYFSADGYFSPALDPKMVNEKFFMVHYRKEIEDAVRLYWKGDIAGINSMLS